VIRDAGCEIWNLELGIGNSLHLNGCSIFDERIKSKIKV
jgi:hypothetical protein